jgi:phosphoribosylamine--glycine ligase
MGTYGPVPLPHQRLAAYFREQLVERVLGGMAERGTPFRGTLFANFMLPPDGDPMLLEINARFGDPETQILSSVVDGDWYEILASAARGQLPERDDLLAGVPRHAVCVVLAAEGYPATPRSGDVLEGLAQAEAVDGVSLHHAGTALCAGRVVTDGGRVLGVTAVAESLRDAHARAYEAASLVRFSGKQLRRDIAARAPGIVPVAE